MDKNENGRVIAIQEGLLKISLKRNEACAKCRACIAGMASQEMIMLAKNECGATLGDTVKIELDESAFIKASLIMYGIPTITMIFGFIFGYALHGVFRYIYPELLSAIFGAAALYCGYRIIKKIEKNIKKDRYEPKAVKIIK